MHRGTCSESQMDVGDQYICLLQSAFVPVMHHRRTSNEDRRRIVESYEAGDDFIALATTLGIKRTTAYSIVTTFQRQSRTTAIEQAGGRPKVIDDETLDLVVTLLEAYPALTLKQLITEVRTLWPGKPHFSDMTLSRALEGELFSVKLTRDTPMDRNSIRVKDARHSYAEWFLSSSLKRVYVDETGFNLWTKRSYGRSRVGERANRIVGGQRGRNATVIAAIAEGAGMLYYELHFGTVNVEIFQNFMVSLEEILGGAQALVIMDNAPVHRGVCEAFPDLNIKFLPPYSPFLNPIENCFSVFKSSLKQYIGNEVERCTTERARRRGTTACALREAVLAAAVEMAVPHITPQLVAKTYNHVNTYLLGYLQHQNIFK